MKLHLYLLNIALSIAGFLFTSHVNAQVYKCTFVDDATRQNKVVYTDSPCHQAQKQTLTVIQTKSSPLSAQALQTAQLAQASAVDSAVTRAVLSRDFKLAKSLATTKEHWRLIAIAEGEAAPQPLIVATSQPVFSPEDECAQAKDNFESVSRTSWRDKDLVAAKKSVMYVACGVPEPVQSQPIFLGRAYGGLHNGSWYHPNHAVRHQTRPHGGVGHHAYPVNHHYHGGNHAGSNASFSYKSKHFGIHVDSVNVR